MGTRVEQSGEFFPRPSRTGRRDLEDMADPLHRLSPTAEDLQVVIPRRYRTLFLQGEFRISLSVICLFGGNVAGMERTQPADLDSAGRPHASMGACRSRTNADD